MNLGIEFPIVQAPMAGVTTPMFVAECAQAGMLGSVGAGYFTAEETKAFVQEVKKLTDRPFAVNLFVPEEVVPAKEQLEDAYTALLPITEQLGMGSWKPSFSKSEFHEQIKVILEEGVKVCSFTFGLPDAETISALKENGVYVIGTATTVEEALLTERAGMDAVVMQGSEAGGHRGSFAGELQFVPLVTLLREAEKVSIPIIAAGGIATKEQMEQAFSLGAAAVQIGTALLAAKESGANPTYKAAVLEAEKGSTVLTKAFSGKYARGIRNQFIDQMQEAAIAPYPYQNDLTKQLRSEAVKQGRREFLSLWAGESVHLSQAGTVKEIVDRFTK